jgi:hypothetical protein
MNLRRMQMKPVVVDDVDVGAVGYAAAADHEV